MSGEGQFNSGLPDELASAVSGRHHELDGFSKIRHMLLCVKRAIRPNAELWVTAFERNLLYLLTCFELHCKKREKERVDGKKNIK